MNDSCMQALREARPKVSDTTDVDLDAIRDRIVASPVAGQAAVRHWAPAPPGRRVVSALAVGAVAIALVLGALSPIGRPTESAYAAVAHAVAKTIELGTSGTVVTSLQAKRADGEPDKPLPGGGVSHELAAADLGSTFRWNGDDFELRGPRDLRLVDGQLYGLTDDHWWHIGELGATPAAGGVGSGMDEWLASSKGAYTERIGSLVKRLDGLVEEDLSDGSKVYTGSATAQVVRECFNKGYQANDNDVVGMMLPKNIAPETQINVRLTVGADGTLAAWTGSYSARGADFVYAPTGTNGSAGYQYPDEAYDFEFTATYKDIGTTPAIERPRIAE